MHRFYFFRAIISVLLLAGCARLTYGEVGINEPVVKGGQREIDNGHVVDVTWLPGIWLAGHRTTHGAVFNSLPNADIGDRVCVYSACFIVFDIRSVPQSYRPPYLAPLVLQTSLPGGRVMLVLAK